MGVGGTNTYNINSVDKVLWLLLFVGLLFVLPGVWIGQFGLPQFPGTTGSSTRSERLFTFQWKNNQPGPVLRPAPQPRFSPPADVASPVYRTSNKQNLKLRGGVGSWEAGGREGLH